MASITEFDEGVSGIVGDADTVANVKAALMEVLRPCDEAVLLPGASQSKDSFTFKSAVITVDGREPDVPYRIFHTDWGHGVSVVRVPQEAAERVLQPKARASMLAALANCCRNALVAADGADIVGPKLGVDESRDAEGDVWVAGFDGANCCVGLYSAVEHTQPRGGNEGMTRAARSYFLVAKAGAGQAGQELSTRVMSAAARGVPLDDIFASSDVTIGMLQRVYSAGRRNRARIIMRAAEVLGLAPDVESAPDHACCEDASGQQVAILLADAVTNVLERVPTVVGGGDESKWRYYAGCVAPTQSQAFVGCSSVTEGMVLFVDPGKESNPVRIANQAHGSAPFGSRRRLSTYDAVRAAADAHHLATVEPSERVHPDGAWVEKHFSWQAPRPPRRATAEAIALAGRIEPPQLWGTHRSLGHTAWVHALGMGQLRAIHLMPELVSLAGAEPDAYRAVVGKVMPKASAVDVA